MDIEPQLLKIDEAATLLNIGRSTAYDLADRGQLPGAVRIGGSLRVSRRILLSWIEQNAAGTSHPVLG